VILTPDFCEEEHTYADAAGNVYPSTTELIGRYWPIDRSRYGDGSAAQRGTNIHKVTEKIDRKKAADWPEEYAGYISAWELAKIDIGFRDFAWIEQRFICDELGYAGTVDRLHMHGADEYWVIDIKTGKKEGWHELQLGAYAVAAEIAGFPVARGYDVYLGISGKYRSPKADIGKAKAAWKALLVWHRYRSGVKR
jgi:hypothetical protein